MPVHFNSGSPQRVAVALHQEDCSAKMLLLEECSEPNQQKVPRPVHLVLVEASSHQRLLRIPQAYSTLLNQPSRSQLKTPRVVTHLQQ